MSFAVIPPLELSAKGIEHYYAILEHKNPVVSTKMIREFEFPRGDMNIKITYQGYSILGRVNGGVMATASKLWRVPNLNPIDCSEDNGEALLILLNIAHLQFRKVPTRLDNKESEEAALGILYHLAILCEKYGLHHLVALWIGKWLEHSTYRRAVQKLISYRRPPASGRMGMICSPKWLYISWSFGLTEEFASICFYWAMMSKSLGPGILSSWEQQDGASSVMLNVKIPPGLLKTIIEERTKMLTHIPEVLQKLTDVISETGRNCPRACNLALAHFYRLAKVEVKGMTAAGSETEHSMSLMDVKKASDKILSYWPLADLPYGPDGVRACKCDGTLLFRPSFGWEDCERAFTKIDGGPLSEYMRHMESRKEEMPWQ